MFKQFTRSAAILAIAFAGSASAAIITADETWNGSVIQPLGTDVTVTAFNGTGGAALVGTKYIPTVGWGAGVAGQGNNEIDAFGNTSEILRFTFGTASVIDILQLGLLFDGPEYTDFEEVAGMNVTFADSTTQLFTLTTKYVSNSQTNYLWDGFGSWSSLSVVDGGAGGWTALNPFGSKGVSQIDFFAINGTCGVGSCNDQSDYVFRSMTTSVPEPGTLALLGIGLVGMGLINRRRRRLQA